MKEKLLLLWKSKRSLIIIVGTALTATVWLIASGNLTDPVEQIDTQIKQENYSEVAEIYDEKIAETDREEEYRETILTIIADTVTAWESGELSYEDARKTLSDFADSDDNIISAKCTEHLSYMAIEEDGKTLLGAAQTALEMGQYVKVFENIINIDSSFSAYEIVEELSEDCQKRTIDSVKAPESEADFRNYIKLLVDCNALIESADFTTRQIQLEEELDLFLAVSEIIETATALYDRSLVEESLMMLTLGLLEFPENERLNTCLVDFSDHYIISISKQTATLCEAEKYNEALDVVECALEEYECDDFYLLRESIKEQKSVLYKFKNDLVRRFEIMAQGWDKESFSVQQAANDTGAYIVKSGKKLLLGDYSNEDVTILYFGGNIVASLAGVDFLFDLRDITYDVTHWGDDEYFAFYLASDVVALLPVVGVAKYFQHFETVSDSVKASADVVDSVADIGKASDKASDMVDTMVNVAKRGDNIADAVDTAKDATKFGQAAKDVISKVTKDYEPISTINHRYLGDIHPDTGIAYQISRQKYSDGKKIVGVFPKFPSSADIELSKDLYKASFPQQEKYCLEQLQKQVKFPFSNTRKNFTDSELDQILGGTLPSGYTWHHNQKEGLMQLVETSIHDATRHTGGMSLWGLGY